MFGCKPGCLWLYLTRTKGCESSFVSVVSVQHLTNANVFPPWKQFRATSWVHLQVRVGGNDPRPSAGRWPEKNSVESFRGHGKFSVLILQK